jgi:hypothetical protein
MNSGVLSLKIHKEVKILTFPADKVLLNFSQYIAEFIAGRIIKKTVPARTGRANSNNIAVTKIAHPNNGNLCNFCPGALMFITVVMTKLKINLK